MKTARVPHITRETEMDPYIRQWMEHWGWQIVGELSVDGIDGPADLAGKKTGEDGKEITIIVEMTSKSYVDRRHWSQAIKWRPISPNVLIAVLVPDLDNWQASQDGSLDSILADALGVGLMALHRDTGEIAILPRVEASLKAGEPAEAILDAMGRYEKAGLNPVGGQPGNAGATEKKIRADKVHVYLSEKAERSGRSLDVQICIFRSWFNNRQDEGIKSELAQDGRFKFSRRRGTIRIRLADEIEEIEG